jgi:hypothetical protein
VTGAATPPIDEIVMAAFGVVIGAEDTEALPVPTELEAVTVNV